MASWMLLVEEKAKNVLTSKISFSPFIDDCSDEEIMNVTAGVYFQWLRAQGRTRVSSVVKVLSDRCRFVYIPPPEYPSGFFDDGEENGKGMGILFPSNGDQIDEGLAWFKEKEYKMNVSCWAPCKEDTALASSLFARGFSIGFISNWLVLDLKLTPLDCSKFRMMDEVRFTVLDDSSDETLWESNEEGHPCYKLAIEKTKQMHQAARLSEGRLVMFAAFLGDVAIASATLYLGKGKEGGVAGLFEVEVTAKYQGKGIGKAISYATCRYAKLMGYRYVLGNSSNEGLSMYYKLGFCDYGRGFVYFLKQHLLLSPVPQEESSFIEAIGCADFIILESLYIPFKGQVLSCGYSAIEIALKVKKLDVAHWLQERGFVLDIISAWELGWRQEIVQLVLHDKSLLLKRSEEHGITPLHKAARDNNEELATILLQTSPDLSITDTTFEGTPLEWAKQCGSTEVILAIEKYERK